MNFQKHTYVRSPRLLRACRLIECQHCGINDGSVCAAHSNQGIHHKAKGIKADDSAVAALCHRCHHAVDQGRTMSRTERVQVWTEAHVKTVAELVRLGLWPACVPVPDTSVSTK